ncbi:MAG: hypothetical protein JWN62_3870, partial [Acidimicrobiales bacterium]|nr:hypothetical protein [Acidimicrobiales bacterium]
MHDRLAAGESADFSHRFIPSQVQPERLSRTVPWKTRASVQVSFAKLSDMELPVISIDESGNTGQNLLDPEQPVFALGSVAMSDEACQSIIGARAAEMHFSRLRRSAAGRRRVLEVLGALDPAAAKVVVVDKRFMVTAKIVDQLVEPQARAVGHDGVADGSMLALSNLWHLTLGVLYGPQYLDRLQRSFVNCVRLRDPASAEEFYLTVHEMMEMTEESRELELLMISDEQMLSVLAEDRQEILEPG